MKNTVINISPQKLVYLGVFLGALSFVLNRFFDSPKLSSFFQGFFLSLAIVFLIVGLYKKS